MITRFFFSLLIISVIACSKNETAGSGAAPTDLNVSAVSTDSSGNISFTASAVNATTYEYDFGNGVFQTVPSGNVTYKYPASGTYTVNVIAKGSGGQTISKSIQVTVALSVTYIWSDEFAIDGAPDALKWSYETGTGNGGWGNNEVQYYTNRSDNSFVSNGTLKIVAKKESYNGSGYTSARLSSKGKYEVKYGKIEMRAKFPAGVGTWPAMWMLGGNNTNVGWPYCGEIDIVEHLGRDINRIFSTLHYPGHSAGNANTNSRVISNATTDFHKYTLDWSATSIKMFVDDQLIHSVPNDNSLPFNQNFFFILNVAMGGNFGGAVDPNFNSGTMEVDYIRVYK